MAQGSKSCAIEPPTIMFSKFTAFLTKKIINCPSCSQKMRVPIKPGKTLKISCPSCKAAFEIRYMNPVRDLLQWNRSKNLRQNIVEIRTHFKQLPVRAKWSIYVFFILTFCVIAMTVSQCSRTAPQKSPSISPTLTL